MEVSVILPAYNEADRIEEAVNQTSQSLEKITSSFEIIIAEDGSNDGTDIIASKLAKKENYVHYIHSDSRQGRGKALNKAFKSASGKTLCYIDVDLSTDMSYLKELIESISVEGYDFATGSRMMPQSQVKRPIKRDIASRGYNFLVRTFLHSKLYDHQCGFKAFRREPLLNLLDKVKDTYWFWDTELFVLSQYYGYKIKEFPIVWKHGGPTKVNFRRDVLNMGKQIFRLRQDLKKKKKEYEVLRGLL
jgi:glycosyltransferase involved in cell wall biosynthesis